MKLDTIQTSFTTGELAPSLFGRTDIAQYTNACAIVQNFLIRPYGPLRSTPGTEYINACKTGGTTGVVRLLEFIFSKTDSYVIEMGVGYFRWYADGGVVVTSGTTPYEVAHTYTEDELFDVQYCQLNDVIYLAHPNHKPQKLTRLAAASWTIEDFAFTGGPFLQDNLGTTTIGLTGTNGTVSLSSSTALFTVSGATTAGHKNAYWKIGATTTDSTTGLDVQGYVQLTNVVSPSTATASVLKILTSKNATTNWAEGAWSDVRGWPARCTFHQKRLFFARTAYEPQSIWGSKSFVYTDFALDGAAADDGINITLASNESNDIKWLASGRDLIAGTYGGEFSITTGDGSPLTPASTNVRKETNWGSESIIPKKIGSFIYYIQRFKMKIRELVFNWDNDVYKSGDMTILAPHIAGTGSSMGFKEFAYQQSPDTVLWCVCSDGTLATMTREIDQEVQGWAKQITDGSYESIASIPSYSKNYDEVWVVVNRNINGSNVRYIERFSDPEVPMLQKECYYVHSGLTYDAFNAYTTTTISLSATDGTNVIVTSSTAYFSTDDVGQRIRTINSDGDTTGEIKITGYTSSTVLVGDVKYAFSASTAAVNTWGVSVETISGLDHLEGETVTVLADGGVDKPNKTVSSGSITLAYDYFYVTVGLPYTQLIKTLPQEAASQRGTAQGKIQRINRVGFKVNRSYAGFDAGGSTDMLDQIQFRDPTTLMGVPEGLVTGTIPNISFRDDYRYGSQVVIQNDDPFPIELLSVITTIDTQDK